MRLRSYRTLSGSSIKVARMDLSRDVYRAVVVAIKRNVSSDPTTAAQARCDPFVYWIIGYYWVRSEWNSEHSELTVAISIREQFLQYNY